MRIYIAGPMSGLPDLNFPAFHEAARNLRASGHEVVNPAEINADPSAGWLECMRADIRELVTCEAIYLLPGWENSRGARLERTIAEGLSMLVVVDRGAWPLSNHVRQSTAQQYENLRAEFDARQADPDVGVVRSLAGRAACDCRTCRPITIADMRMVLCPSCGNKRCPAANDHRNACTGSNAPGQAGSAYA